MKKCYVIVVTYNGLSWYDKCFGSLLKSKFPVEVVVIDNKSTDNSVDYISKNFPGVKIIESNENLGFAKANNIGFRYAYENNADFYFLLNQDAWIEENTIEKLIEFSEKHSDYGIISPIHLTGDKKHFDSHFLRYFCTLSETYNAYESLYLKNEPDCYNTTFVNAAAWLVTKRCLETTGGFDTILFKHYGEDTNYSHRVLYHGFKIAIVPSVTICHDRENRNNQDVNVSIVHAYNYSNILNGKAYYIKRFIIVFIKIISVKLTIRGIKEILYVIKNINKIISSRKINKKKGGGFIYLTQ